MTACALKSRGRTIVKAIVLATSVLMIGAGLASGAGTAQAAPRQSAQIARIAVPAPCASQGSCQYCGIGGIWTGNCTRAKLEYNVAWCGRNRSHLSSYNKAKCKAEAGYLGSGPPDQILPWIKAVCAPPAARTVIQAVKGLSEKPGWVGVACAGIEVYGAFRSLLFEIL
jgi:hypothetical protein